ncbi:unnamed protein product [Pylaiella littoralis]
MDAGGSSSSSSSDRRIEPSQRLRQRQRQRQQQTAAWPLLVSAGDAGSDENVAGSDGEGEGEVDGDGDGEGLLLFGGLDSGDGGDDGDDEERGEVVEVDEEDLREDWIARGLNPEAFDPFVLLQMWEEDEQVDREEYDKEAVDAMMADAAAESASAGAGAGESEEDGMSQGKGSGRGRFLKERKVFQGMDGDDEDDDVDAVMAAAAAAAGPRSELLEDDAELAAGASPEAGYDEEEASPVGGTAEGRAVGIDLGTTNSAVAVIVDGKPVMVPNSRGSFTTPSVVSFKVRSSRKKNNTKQQQQQQQREGQAPFPSSTSTSASTSSRRNNNNNNVRAARRRAPAALGGGGGGGGERDLDYDYSSSSSESPVVAPASGKAEGSSSSSSSSSKTSATEEDRQQGAGSGSGGLARIYVGEAAVARIATHPKSTYSSVKRIVGRTKKQAKEAGVGLGALNVDQSQPFLRLKCPTIGDGATIPPEDISAEILRVLIRDAERFMGGDAKVKRAVVAVPAYFNPAQCAATERAGQLAGLEKVKLMREPEAAALAYGLDKGGDELILVFDLGGGTFDISVLEVGGGIAEVIATAGDSQLGGDDFDQAVTEWLFDEIVNLGGGDARSSPVATRQLLEAARSARERLSNAPETEVELAFADGRTGRTTLSRSKMESLIMEPLKRIMAPMREAAIMADVSLPGDTGAFMDYDLEDTREFRDGGATSWGEAGTAEGADGEGASLRKLRNAQSKAKKKARVHSKSLRKQVSSMAEVARGMEGNAKLRRFPQGGRMVDKVVLVGGATRMPCVQRLVGGITGVKPKRTVDPDQAVALGAAAFAGILEGEVEGQEVMTSWQASIYRMMARDGMMP